LIFPPKTTPFIIERIMVQNARAEMQYKAKAEAVITQVIPEGTSEGLKEKKARLL